MIGRMGMRTIYAILTVEVTDQDKFTKVADWFKVPPGEWVGEGDPQIMAWSDDQIVTNAIALTKYPGFAVRGASVMPEEWVASLRAQNPTQ